MHHNDANDDAKLMMLIDVDNLRDYV